MNQRIAKFEFALGARFQAGANQDPEAVGRRIESLREKFKGELTPEDVLNDAQDENSPLHTFFEWDDSAAAHQHRLQQARGLIRAVVAVYVRNDRPAMRTRAYVHIPQGETSHYREASHAMSVQATRDAVLRRALEELIGWQRRYKDLHEFADFCGEIDQLKLKLTA